MKKLMVSCLIALSSCAITANALSPSRVLITQALDVAPENGFGGYNQSTGIGTSGGSKASSKMIFLVKNKQDLLTAIKIGRSKPKIIQVEGIIDISENQPYENYNDQKSRSLIKIPSNTTLIGVGDNASFINGSIILSNVSNIIIRNIHIQAPIDVEPKFEQGDGWNAEWDGINIITSTYVWIDHVTFTDGNFTDDKYKKKDNWKYVQHDGLLDIKRGSDLITVSYCLFENHDKTILIGHNDKNDSQDENKLHITFHHNSFSNVRQRAPRVRFGKIHMYNNVFTGSVSKSQTIYPYLYSIGLGIKSSVISENNLFLIDGLKDSCKIVKDFKSNNIRDTDSIFNKSLINWSTCHFDNGINWIIPYQYVLDEPRNLNITYGKLVGNGKL